MIRRRLFALALALLAAVPAPGAASSPPAGDARAFVDSVAARCLRLPHYRLEGEVYATATGALLPAQPPLVMPFAYAAVRPGKLHNDMRTPYMPTRVIANGDSLWIWAPGLKQYSVQRAPAIVPGAKPDAVALSFDAVLFLADGLTQQLASARFLGADTVRTGDGPVACRIVELTYEADPMQQQSRELPRVLWIDEARSLVLRDSTTTELTHAQYGDIRQARTTRYVVADLSVPADSLFRFTRPADAKRVRRVGQQAQDDHAGEPAKDFSLALLDGKGRKVSLASMRGKVVVLDFWATWCGPCRRWMPVVAKLEKETAGMKDVKFFAVNLHEPVAEVRAYVQEQKIAVPVLLDADGAVGVAYGARSIPLTVIVGRDGKIVTTLVGVHPEEDLREALREAGVAAL